MIVSMFGLLALLGTAKADWNPFSGSESIYGNIASGGYAGESQDGGGQCEVYKVAMQQDYFEQYIEYKVDMPSLKELTLCHWSKFYNHSNDHPIFAYGGSKQPREIYSWVSNSEESSYFSMAISGQTFYRLNYPLRLRKWYHVCQSWNGRTGEWQIWVNAERVGRGFHNRLVGHIIPHGGLAVTGQELANDKKDSRGLQGEITMVQLYGVALTAGKAHRDHKHHHAHKFDHNGVPITTPAPSTPNPRPTLPTHPLLTAGQINPSVRLNIAGAQNPQQPVQLLQGQQYNVQYANGQFVGGLVSQQLQQQQQQQVQPAPPQPQQQQQQQQFFPVDQSKLQDLSSFSQQSFSVGNVQLLSSGVQHPTDYLQDSQKLYKREDKQERVKREDNEEREKRALFLAGGTLLSDDEDYGGLATIGENQPILHQQQKNDEREPAEAETKAVMNICTACDDEPFEKALVFGWRTVQLKLHGTTYTPAIPQCTVF